MEITESTVVESASKVAAESLQEYLQNALDEVINNDQYQQVTGHTLENDAEKAIQDNSDTLLEIAEDDSVDSMVESVRTDSGLQDLLYDTLLEGFNDGRENLDKQNIEFAQKEIAKRINATLDEDGISSALFAKLTGSTVDAIAEEIAKELQNGAGKGTDAKEQYIDIPVVDDFIYNYESRIRENAASKVYDALMGQTRGKEMVDYNRIQSNDYDNCRYASGTLSLDNYLEKNFPEL